MITVMSLMAALNLVGIVTVSFLSFARGEESGLPRRCQKSIRQTSGLLQETAPSDLEGPRGFTTFPFGCFSPVSVTAKWVDFRFRCSPFFGSDAVICVTPLGGVSRALDGSKRTLEEVFQVIPRCLREQFGQVLEGRHANPFQVHPLRPEVSEPNLEFVVYLEMSNTEGCFDLSVCTILCSLTGVFAMWDPFICECDPGFKETEVDGEKVCRIIDDCGGVGCGEYKTCVDLVDGYRCRAILRVEPCSVRKNVLQIPRHQQNLRHLLSTARRAGLSSICKLVSPFSVMRCHQ